MTSWFLISLLFAIVGTCLHAQDARPVTPQEQIGPLSIRAYGFVEWIGVTRSVATTDTISTRLGSTPFSSTGSQTLASPNHSRIQIDTQGPLAGGVIAGYLEADFLSRDPSNPYRNRQYFAQYRRDDWEVSAGRMWSFLRPNRAGITAYRDMLNTYVVDPAYQVGLAGVRDRQVRLVHHGESWHAGVSFENRGDILPKIAHDSANLHWEVTGLAGRHGRHGGSLAVSWRLNPRLQLVGQQFLSRAGGPDALSTAPAEVLMNSSMAGIESQVAPDFRVFAYAGVVYAGRSQGNRDVHEYTVGASRRLLRSHWGELIMACQLSQLDRYTWTGKHGAMTFAMSSIRYSFGTPR